MYSVEEDRRMGIVRITSTGFWDVSTVDAMIAELVPIVRRIQASGGPLLMVNDAREFPVQSKDVRERFSRMGKLLGMKPDRLAIISTSALFKLQGQRVDTVGARYFPTPEEAEAWLLGTLQPAG
jgi:hypothetical protein